MSNQDFFFGTTLTIECSDDSEGRLKRICEFWDERYGKNRSITDVDWSPKVSQFFSTYLN